VKVIWSPLAEQRAAEATDSIIQDQPQAAAAWLEELIERVARLDRLARRGRMVREIGLPAYREILHAPYRVIYRVDAARVVILTLRHWRRAWDPAEVSDGA
jgi:plasmid stabilization system protein ParE